MTGYVRVCFPTEYCRIDEGEEAQAGRGEGGDGGGVAVDVVVGVLAMLVRSFGCGDGGVGDDAVVAVVVVARGCCWWQCRGHDCDCWRCCCCWWCWCWCWFLYRCCCWCYQSLLLLRGTIVNRDLRDTQKPTYFPIFTNNIWSY